MKTDAMNRTNSKGKPAEPPPRERKCERVWTLPPAVAVLLWDQWLDARVYPKPPGLARAKSRFVQ